MAAAPRIKAHPRKRVVPDDALIYREYAHQLMSKGAWGAYSRTARICRVSHEHVRKVVARHLPPPSDDAVAYVPAPGEVKYRQFCATQPAPIAPEQPSLPQSDAEFLQTLLSEELPTPQAEITSTPRSIAPATKAESATVERSVHFIEYSIICNAGSDRERENRRIGFWYLLSITLVVTLLMILLARKTLLLPLLLFPEVMGMWWVILQFRRVVIYLRE